jgi:small-conductance mechanosensitive channel
MRLILLLLLAALCASAAGEGVREGMAVKVANRTVIVLYGPIAGFSAKDRVTGAMERIELALQAERQPAISTEPAAEGTVRVLLGGKHAFLVTRVDIDESAGESTDVVARAAVSRLEQALVERTEQATPGYLARAVAVSLAATLLAGLLLLLLVRLRRWALQRIGAAASAHSVGLKVAGVPIFSTDNVLMLTRPLPGLLVWLAALLLAWAWLSFVLRSFPYTRPWGEHLGAELLGILGGSGAAALDALPGLLVVAVVVVVARSAQRILNVFFQKVERGRLHLGGLDPDTAGPTRRVVGVAIWIFAIAMAYPYLPGAQTEAFKGLSVLLGLMVSLGAASVVGQAFSGLILMYNRAYRVGDYVRIGTTEGTVTALNTFVTHIRTGLGSDILVPNAIVMASGITNYSGIVKGAGFVIDTVVTIGYSTPWRQVHAMLLEAARRTPDVAAVPAPGVRQTSLSDFYVEYRLIAYTPAEQPRARAEVLSDLHASIQDVFNEHGVQIMSPHYVLDPKEPQVVPREKWHEPPARKD